jgi:hypothetical protein
VLRDRLGSVIASLSESDVEVIVVQAEALAKLRTTT